jgi:hypothetical protein
MQYLFFEEWARLAVLSSAGRWTRTGEIWRAYLDAARQAGLAAEHVRALRDWLREHDLETRIRDGHRQVFGAALRAAEGEAGHG